MAIDTALAANPHLSQAWLARGQLSYLKKRHKDALDDWARSLDLDPNQPGVAAACLRARMHLCDWSDFETACASVRASVRDGKVVAPFVFIALPSTPAEQLQCARRWIDHNFRAFGRPVWRGSRSQHARIRVAYLSADFHEHATSQLLVGVLEHHDRSRFEVTGISVGPDDNSPMRRRVEAALERFVDVASESDDQIAKLVEDLQIDILVDLKGYTQDARTGVLAMRPAPIQVNYLGFPATIGADFIDYVIADRHLIPQDEHACYAEKIVRLPYSYQANDNLRELSDATATRAQHGLPENAFVFCCFNDTYKITPSVFSSWMQILHEVENSVLWLFEDNSTAADNLRREAAARGVVPTRLVFARRAPNSQHLARLRCADLVLDTLPYGAHTTASDALWAGVPVLTCRGKTLAGRVGASLLNVVGLPQLITSTPAEYHQLAVRLARNPDQLAALRAKLSRDRLTSPLFDTARTTRDIEAAYFKMMERHLVGLPPDDILVDG
jgi:protein O-GlcNAc transferase